MANAVPADVYHSAARIARDIEDRPMPTPTSGLFRVIALASVMVAATACSDHRTAERADSDLSHDLALAGQMNGQPALQDTAVANQAQPQAAPVPASPSPQSVPAASRQPSAGGATPLPASQGVAQQSESTAIVGAAPGPAAVAKAFDTGTQLALSSGMRVCTSTNKVGDRLVATVTSPVIGTGGAMIPAGSRVVLEVAHVNSAESPDGGSIVLKPAAIYIGGLAYPATGDIVSTTPAQRVQAPTTGPSDKEKVVGGAIAGAILGQIFGRNTKSTVIGAAAGAATGAVVAKAQQSYQACLPEGSALTLTLSAPVTMN